MSKPDSGSADEESNQPEGEPAALRTEINKPGESARNMPNNKGFSGDAEAPFDDVEADAGAGEKAEVGEPAKVKRRVSRSQVVAYGFLPGLALLMALAIGFLKWQDSSVRESQIARVESISVAKDSTIALLSYKADSVEKDLEAAKSRLTGTFKDSYSQLIKDVVIPGAKKGHVSTTATVPAAASVSANPNHAVALLFVNQSAVVDKGQPTDTSSSVRVTLDKVDGRWLISGFDPV